MRLLAGVFQLFDLLAHLFVIPGQEVAYVDYNINLVGPVGNGQSRLGYLHLGKGLRRGETARYGSNIHGRHVEVGANGSGKVGIDTDGSHVVHLGMLLFKIVHPLGHARNRLGVILGMQRRQVDAVEQKLVHIGCTVCGQIVANDFPSASHYLGIVQIGVVPTQHFFVFVQFILHVWSV